MGQSFGFYKPGGLLLSELFGSQLGLPFLLVHLLFVICPLSLEVEIRQLNGHIPLTEILFGALFLTMELISDIRN